MEIDVFKKQVKMLLSQDKTNKAFELLEKYIDAEAEIFDSFVLLKSKYSFIEKGVSLGLINKHEESQMRANLSNGLLTILNSIELSDLNDTEIKIRTSLSKKDKDQLNENSEALKDFFSGIVSALEETSNKIHNMDSQHLLKTMDMECAYCSGSGRSDILGWIGKKCEHCNGTGRLRLG